jgi:hypothetical protein
MCGGLRMWQKTKSRIATLYTIYCYSTGQWLGFISATVFFQLRVIQELTCPLVQLRRSQREADQFPSRYTCIFRHYKIMAQKGITNFQNITNFGHSCIISHYWFETFLITNFQFCIFLVTDSSNLAILILTPTAWHVQSGVFVIMTMSCKKDYWCYR